MQILRQRAARLQAQIPHGEALPNATFLETNCSKLLGSMMAVGVKPYLLGHYHRLLAEERRLLLQVVASLIALIALALNGPLSQMPQSL